MNILRRLRLWARWRQFDVDMRDELEFHRAEVQRSLEAQGLSRADAAHESRRRMGNSTLAREDARQIWIAAWLDVTGQDVRYAVRAMRKTPGFTLTVLLTLALGIGANTAVFSLVDALMLRALPVHDPGSLVEMVYQYPGDPRLDLFRWQDYQRLRASNHVFSAVIGATGRELPVVFDGGAPASTETMLVTGAFFPELGVQPAFGRVLDPSDDTPVNAGVAMISWRAWNVRFNGDPRVLGRRIVVNNAPVTIVGVTPQAFATGITPGLAVDVWIPVSLTPRLAPQVKFPEAVGLALLGRLKPGISIDQARAEMRVLDRPRIDEFAARDPVWRAVVVDVQPAETGLSTLRDQFGATVLMLMGMVSLLLLIACTNLAGLQLSRGIARRREMGVRAALGGGRGRLLRQLLTEAALLSIAGAAIAVDLAWLGSDALLRLIAAGHAPIPGWPALPDIHVGPDGRVLLLTGTIAVLTTLLFGSTAAWPSLAGGPAAALADRSPGGRSRLRTGGSLVVAQLALSIALLSTAVMVTRYLSQLRHSDLGFDRQSVLLMKLEPRDQRANRTRRNAEYRDLLDRLRRLPGVRAASLSAVTPIQLGAASHFVSVDGAAESMQERRRMMENWVSPGYFDTLRTPIVAGRDFVPGDDSGRPAVIVNEAMVRHYFPNGPLTEPLGRLLSLDGSQRRYEIVGVVGDAKYNDLHEPPPPTVYFDAFQEHVGSSFAIRTVASSTVVAPDARRAAEELAKSSRVGEMTTLVDQMDASIVPERVTAALAIVFGTVGALLAAVGVYGLLAFTMARRTHEIGIRLAIGATRGDILRMILRQAGVLALAGVAAGAPLAVWTGRIAATIVPHLALGWFGAIGLAAAALSGVALLAAALPARRASRVEPMDALRHL